MKFLRGLGGVLAGFVLFLVVVRSIPALAGVDEMQMFALNYLLLSLAFTVAAALVSGFVTALLAGSHEFPSAAALGVLMVGSAFFSMRQEGFSRPGWYETTIAGCGPVSAMIGAAIRVLTKI